MFPALILILPITRLFSVKLSKFIAPVIAWSFLSYLLAENYIYTHIHREMGRPRIHTNAIYMYDIHIHKHSSHLTLCLAFDCGLAHDYVANIQVEGQSTICFCSALRSTLISIILVWPGLQFHYDCYYLLLRIWTFRAILKLRKNTIFFPTFLNNFYLLFDEVYSRKTSYSQYAALRSRIVWKLDGLLHEKYNALKYIARQKSSME